MYLNYFKILIKTSILTSGSFFSINIKNFFLNELNTGSSRRLVSILIIFSLSISLSFCIPCKKIDNRIPIYHLNCLPILIISTDTVGDLFLIFIYFSLILSIKKGSIGNLLLLPLGGFI